MSDFFLDKIAITNKILEIINPDFTESEKQLALFRWWKNIRPTGGLRLSDLGNQAFLEATITYHDIKTSDSFLLTNSKRLLQLEKFMLCPYYLMKHGTIRLYDERISIIAELHGNFFGYLDTLEVSRHQLIQSK